MTRNMNLIVNDFSLSNGQGDPKEQLRMILDLMVERSDKIQCTINIYQSFGAPAVPVSFGTGVVPNDYTSINIEKKSKPPVVSTTPVDPMTELATMFPDLMVDKPKIDTLDIDSLLGIGKSGKSKRKKFDKALWRKLSTCTKLKLTDEHILEASCKVDHDKWKSCKLDLNQHLMNDDGFFSWNSEGNFFASARNVRLDDDLCLLADLRTIDGEWRSTFKSLAQMIINDGGKLVVDYTKLEDSDSE